MLSLLTALALTGACFAQTNVNLTVDVGGSTPPITHPNVMGYDALTGPYKHVVILSVDGFHHVDLATYVSMKPSSNFASLLMNSVWYQNVMGSKPSDSFPGTTALYTGATPRTSGIWYDDAWDRALYPYSANCTGAPGFNIVGDETVDANDTILTGGGAFDETHLPYTKTPWGACNYLLPHNFLRVRTIFEVVRQSGGFTKLTDKHPAYEIFNGPSGTGVYETYFPEINSIPTELAPTEVYDDLHWQALYNWTAGNFQNGTKDPNGVATLYASNFQSVSVAQKAAGYANGSTSAKPIFTDNITKSIDFIDTRLGTLVSKLKEAGTYDQTLLIVTAKHGQTPLNPSTSKKISPDGIQNASSVEFAKVTADDIGLIWLADQTDANVAQAKSDLLAAKSNLSISTILTNEEIYQNGFGDPKFDPRVPDLIIIPNSGVIYASPTASKVMEHGGVNPDDLSVALFVHNPNIKGSTSQDLVYSRQVAVTAVMALGAPVAQLDGAAADGTAVLPGLGF